MDIADQSELSIRYHSVVISSGTTEINTWDDWHLIPAEPPIINPPEVKTKFVEIPGMNGQLDLTDIRGEVKYGDRKGSWSFYVTDQKMDREELFEQIRAFLHGKNFQIHLLDDLTLTYEGRLYIDSLNNGKNFSKVNIGYTLKPGAFYPDTVNTPEGWLWDPFNFEMDRVNFNTDPQSVIIRKRIL